MEEFVQDAQISMHWIVQKIQHMQLVVSKDTHPLKEFVKRVTLIANTVEMKEPLTAMMKRAMMAMSFYLALTIAQNVLEAVLNVTLLTLQCVYHVLKMITWIIQVNVVHVLLNVKPVHQQQYAYLVTLTTYSKTIIAILDQDIHVLSKLATPVYLAIQAIKCNKIHAQLTLHAIVQLHV